MDKRILAHWLQDQLIQNYGDYLSEYLYEKLFVPLDFYSASSGASLYRIIGSCLDDGLVAQDMRQWSLEETDRMVFWGCGCRDTDSFNLSLHPQCEILAVRGPASREVVGCRNLPLGDPALLLPCIYKPSTDSGFQGKRVLIPHFQDKRADAELVALTGADVVLRPNIARTSGALQQFVDRVCSSAFVLCGSLHGAITAAAYGRPYGYWQSGAVDLPFKWQDFSALMGYDAQFFENFEGAVHHYAHSVRPMSKIPALLPLLESSPFLVRREIHAACLVRDALRHSRQQGLRAWWSRSVAYDTYRQNQSGPSHAPVGG